MNYLIQKSEMKSGTSFTLDASVNRVFNKFRTFSNFEKSSPLPQTVVAKRNGV